MGFQKVGGIQTTSWMKPFDADVHSVFIAEANSLGNSNVGSTKTMSLDRSLSHGIESP